MLKVQVGSVTVVEILAGSVLFEDNYQLCFIDTILWSDVLTHRRTNYSIYLNDPVRPAAKCNCHLLLNVAFHH